ncbi:MAG: DUF1449 family protein [Anaerohalosphaera sp.]|nr:DUF1449 family protein [Anaerohalosphaera sp.]
MQEILHEALMPVNAVFTIMLLLVLLYWIMVILGALDVSFLDMDLDADFDADVDVDVDVDVDMDMQGGGILRALLVFFYVGEVPVMIIVSLLALTMWVVSMTGNHYFNPAGSMLLGLPIFAATLFVSACVCKVTIMPMRKMFSMFEKDSNAPRKVLGRICTVVTTELTDNLGQAEVSTKGAPILLNVMAQQGCVFHKGDEAVVIEKNNEKGVYIIAPVELEK